MKLTVILVVDILARLRQSDTVEDHIDRLENEGVMNPNNESIKKMDPFMAIILEMNEAIEIMVMARQRLVKAMCELSDYPEIIINAQLTK